MSPAEAKIIVGGPRTLVGGEATRATTLTLMCVLTRVPGQQSDGQQPAGSWKGH